MHIHVEEQEDGSDRLVRQRAPEIPEAVRPLLSVGGLDDGVPYQRVEEFYLNTCLRIL
jgi:hypothetical protein